MDASKNVTVNNCTFTGYKASKRHTSEAINLDTPDKKTKGFTHDWSKYDCTANQNVKITKCIFSNLEKAIGTHQYSVKKYHTGITISDCTIKKLCHCYQRSPPLLLEVGDFPNIRLPVLLCLHSYHSQKS